jgi:chemotaxis methyl-accepting protein methylase
MLNFSLTDVLIPCLETTELEDLLQYLKRSLQIDLTGYKRASLMRRTLVRMQRVGIEHYQGYLAYLQQQPDEATHLLDTIFINFTGFFRDRSVWDYLAHQIIPQMIANTASHQPICIWSAGCASGEETYSLAMLLMEALGLEQFQHSLRDSGLLRLGQAENWATRSHRSLFKSVHPRTRAFTKVLDPACFL